MQVLALVLVTSAAGGALHGELTAGAHETAATVSTEIYAAFTDSDDASSVGPDEASVADPSTAVPSDSEVFDADVAVADPSDSNISDTDAASPGPDTEPTATVPSDSEMLDSSVELANSSSVEERSATALGSSAATPNNLPEWFSATVCTAGANHTRVMKKVTTPSEPAPPPAASHETVLSATTIASAQETVESSDVETDSALKTETEAASTTTTTTTTPRPRPYRAPPSPEPAAFYVDDV